MSHTLNLSKKPSMGLNSQTFCFSGVGSGWRAALCFPGAGPPDSESLHFNVFCHLGKLRISKSSDPVFCFLNSPSICL